jgi:hypothetical protein
MLGFKSKSESNTGTGKSEEKVSTLIPFSVWTFAWQEPPDHPAILTVIIPVIQHFAPVRIAEHDSRHFKIYMMPERLHPIAPVVVPFFLSRSKLFFLIKIKPIYPTTFHSIWVFAEMTSRK